MRNLFVIAFLALTVPTLGDTIKLRNGREILGKVVRHLDDPAKNVPAGMVRVDFKNGGWFMFSEKDVESVEVNDRDQFEERAGK